MAKELMEIGGFITSGAEIVNHDASLSGNGTLTSPLGVNDNNWYDVTNDCKASNITAYIDAGGWQFIYNPAQKMLNAVVDVHYKSVSSYPYTWPEYLKPVANSQFAIGNAIYINSSGLFNAQASARWHNGCFMWPVKGPQQ